MSLKKSKVLPIGFFLLFTIAPLGLGLSYALLYSLGLVGGLSQGITFYHWKAVLASPDLIQSILLSLLIATISLFISIGLGLFFTLRLRTSDFGLRTSLFYLPLSIPPIIAAFLTFQFLSNAGMLSRLFHAVGLISNPESFPALVNDRWYVGVMIAQIWTTFPFLTLLFVQLYRSTHIEGLVQVAKTLGARDGQIIRNVVTPVLLDAAQPNLVLLYIALMSSYEIPLLLGRQSPMMLSVLISQKFRKFNLADIPQAYIIAIIYAVLALTLVAIVFNKKHEKA